MIYQRLAKVFLICSLANVRRGPLGSLGMVAVLAAQVREQEHQRKRERPDKRSNPRTDLEAASSTLSNSTGNIDPVSYTHLRAHETPEHLVCRLLLEKKK